MKKQGIDKLVCMLRDSVYNGLVDKDPLKAADILNKIHEENATTKDLDTADAIGCIAGIIEIVIGIELDKPGTISNIVRQLDPEKRNIGSVNEYQLKY